jgi:hypothetical protein
MVLAAIEFGTLFEVIWTALLAGVAITVIYSLVIYGSSQAAEARRDGRGLAATGHAILAAVAMAGVVVSIALALIVILDKG